VTKSSYLKSCLSPPSKLFIPIAKATVPLSQRSKAFAVYAYPCIGQLRFLNTRLAHHPSYPTVLARLRAGATLLDAGCCFAQELRHLVREGIPSTQLYGFDLKPRFIEFGYDLFRDRDLFQATLLVGDVLAEPGSKGSGGLDTLVGEMDVVFASSFLHLWDWADMKVVAKRLVAFTRQAPGAVVLGRQLGSLTAGSRSMPMEGGSSYWHNVESMREFWEEVGEETETRWAVEGGLREEEEITENMGHAWAEPSMRILWWTAVRQ